MGSHAQEDEEPASVPGADARKTRGRCVRVNRWVWWRERNGRMIHAARPPRPGITHSLARRRWKCAPERSSDCWSPSPARPSSARATARHRRRQTHVAPLHQAWISRRRHQTVREAWAPATTRWRATRQLEGVYSWDRGTNRAGANGAGLRLACCLGLTDVGREGPRDASRIAWRSERRERAVLEVRHPAGAPGFLRARPPRRARR